MSDPCRLLSEFCRERVNLLAMRWMSGSGALPEPSKLPTSLKLEEFWRARVARLAKRERNRSGFAPSLPSEPVASDAPVLNVSEFWRPLPARFAMRMSTPPDEG